MPYILPKVEVDQQFTQVPVFAAQPLSALVIGPQYQLFRNDEASEKALILDSNGDTAYYSGSETDYHYPGSRPATSVVDLAWDKTEVLFENVLGKYFPNTDLGSTGTYTTAAVGSSKYKLQLKSGSTGLQLKTVGTTTRASFLSNRDVQAGDYAYVHGSGGAPVMTKIVAVRQEATLASKGPVTTSGTVTNVTNDGADGTFVGTKDAVYCLKITKAGPWYAVGENEATAAKARITSTNADSSAEFYVGKGVDFDLGSSGVTLSLAGSATSLALNAAWYVPMTAAGLGAASIIEVADDISTITDAVVELYAKASSYVVPQAKDLVGNVNWSLDSANVTMNAGISLLIPTLLTTAAEMAPLPISIVVNYEPTMYIQYRALLKDNTTSLSSLTDPAEVAAVLGPINLDNPLSQGVYDALLNSGGTPVYYAGVATDDLDGYNTALDLATQSDAVYSTVPLTFNTEVQTAVEAHTNAMSAAGEAKWRIAWISKPLTTSALVLDLNSAGADSLASASSSAGTVTFTGVVLHDIARVGDDVLLYDFAAGSSSAFSTGTITEIVGNTVAKVSPAFGDTADGHPVKVQIRRNYTKNEQIANLAASNTSNRRVRTIFPDIQRIGSVEKPGYFTAAALAGLRSSVVPHQGLTNTEVLGVVGLDRALYEFSSTQLNTLAAAGFWIVTQAGIGGTAYVRHQLTSDMSSLNKSEDSVTANVDSISYGIQRALAPFIGKYNVTPFNLLALRKVVESELNFRKLSTYTVSAGNQLIDYAITKLEQNATFKDRVDITVSLTVPYPMNNINLTFIV